MVQLNIVSSHQLVMATNVHEAVNSAG